MRYDDEIKLADSGGRIRETMASKIIERIRQEHPRYTAPDALVTAELIRHIEQSHKKEVGMDEDEVLFELSSEQAQSIVSGLSVEEVSSPLKVQTIISILDKIDDLAWQEFVEGLPREEVCQEYTDGVAEGILGHECREDALSFNNWGNDLSTMGRYDEALSAYNRACELEPGSITPLMNRASLYLKLGMKDKALVDSRHMLANMRGSQVENLYGGTQLSNILFHCNEDHLALSVMANFFEAFNELIHYHVSEDFGDDIRLESIEIKKEGYHTEISYAPLLEQTAECIMMIKEIEKRNTGDLGLQAMIENLKVQILTLRIWGNF